MNDISLASTVHYWSTSVKDTLSLAQTSSDGLSSEEVEKRLQLYGPNLIDEAAAVSPWVIWWRQFRSLIVVLLVIAAAISFAIGDLPEAIAVLAVVLINALIGFFTELKATQSMAALKKMSLVMARVSRNGKAEKIPSRDLVPGDWVILEAGDLIPADLRIIEANSLQSDESALTGESLPIRKTHKEQPDEAPLAERKSMLYRGAKITGGTGTGVVVGTGKNSELGKISTMVSSASHHATPLEKQLDRLGYRLVWITLGLMLLMTLAGIIKGIEILTMVQTSIALAIAAIPEGLPIVATIALANGLWKMARRNAIINHLSAVETLGSTGVICTDKTGTLTENKMTVSVLWPAGSSECFEAGSNLNDTVKQMMTVSALCNNAEVTDSVAVGDPLEIALIEWVAKSDIDLNELNSDYPRLSETPFDAEVRMMTTLHEHRSRHYTAVKGAAEALLPLCSFDKTTESKSQWEQRNLKMARRGLRVIAVARKLDDEKMEFIGLIGLIDPPRPEVSAAIEECQSAGIRIVMITGDQAPTAIAIANQIGIKEGEALTGAELADLDFESPRGIEILNNVSIIARSNPAQKLSLVKYFQSRNHVVAMTGDGVNDAPALKQADIGVAMGQRGTDVAREAAAMVLQDDSFSSIVVAIRQGRIILSNIRKFVVYLMSCNISEIMVVWISMMFTSQLPLLPLQILFLNLVTDVFPALALGVTPGNGRMMNQTPGRAGESILKKDHWTSIFRHGITIALATFGAFMYAIHNRGMLPEQAVTISFLTLAVAQLFHVFNMADRRSSLLSSEVVKNRWVWSALLLCITLLAAACYIPTLAKILALRPPGSGDLMIICGFAAIPVLIEAGKRGIQKISRK